MVLSADGLIYAWGDNNYGQLATGNTGQPLRAIRIATELSDISQIAALHTYSVSAAITRTNEVYIWGCFSDQIFLKPHLTSFNCIDDVFSCLKGNRRISFRPLMVGNKSRNIFLCVPFLHTSFVIQKLTQGKMTCWTA